VAVADGGRAGGGGGVDVAAGGSGVLVDVGSAVLVGVLVDVGSAVFVGVLVGVFVGVFVGVSVGVFVGVFVDVAVGVSVGVLVGVAVAVGVFVGVAVGVSVGVGVAVGVFVGVAVGSGPIQMVTCTDDCTELFPVSSSRIVCKPAFSVDELRVNDGPLPRKPFWDDVQKSWPRTSGVPSESAPQPEKVITVLKGMTAPSAGEMMAPDGGPTAVAETRDGAGARESIASDTTSSAEAEKSRDVRTATPHRERQM
jgi:hypothetical protein